MHPARVLPVLTADRLVGGLVLLKAVDVLLRGPQELPAPVWVVVLATWVTAGAGLVAAPARAAWAGVLVAGVGLAADLPLELRRQHLVLPLGVALAALVAADDRERLLLWRTQLTVLYGVAALAKLNASFLSGDVLAVTLATGPLGVVPPAALLVLVGAALVVAEAGLATALWRPDLHRAGLAVAVLLHLVALPVAGADPLVALRLVVFGGTAVVLWAACAGAVRPSAARQPAGRRP